MTHHASHGHEGHGHHDHAQHAHEMTWRKKVRKNWHMWLIVALMLATMGIYLISMDESIQPGSEKQGQSMPAAPGPPAPVPTPAAP